MNLVTYLPHAIFSATCFHLFLLHDLPISNICWTLLTYFKIMVLKSQFLSLVFFFLNSVCSEFTYHFLFDHWVTYLKMETIRSSETLITASHPDNHNTHFHRRETLKFHLQIQIPLQRIHTTLKSRKPVDSWCLSEVSLLILWGEAHKWTKEIKVRSFSTVVLPFERLMYCHIVVYCTGYVARNPGTKHKTMSNFILLDIPLRTRLNERPYTTCLSIFAFSKTILNHVEHLDTSRCLRPRYPTFYNWWHLWEEFVTFSSSVTDSWVPNGRNSKNKTSKTR